MKFEYEIGATPYMEADYYNLIPKHITLQKELNEWEQANILGAINWAFNNKKSKILEADFIKKLHFKMFNETWKWAGKYRQYQTNIGCQSYEIEVKLHELLSNIKYFIENQIYDLEEIAVRLHHGLALIHCFPNGNGRHARIMADLFLFNNSFARFTWGRGSLYESSEIRKKYISALRLADNFNFIPLIEFAKS